MCNPTSKIHFCTCTSLKKKPFPITPGEEVNKIDYEKTHYIWALFKYLGEKDSLIMGDMIMPVDNLDEKLTTEYLLQQLNFQNRFDFEYSPSEGDNLQIRKEYIYKSIKGIPRPDLYDYMSFIYRNGQWKEEVYDVFTDKTRQIKKGEVQFKDENN